MGDSKLPKFPLKFEWASAELQGADGTRGGRRWVTQKQNNNSFTEELQQLIDANTAQNTKNKTKYDMWYRWCELMQIDAQEVKMQL